MQKQLINGKENQQLSKWDFSFFFHGFSVFTTFLSFQQKPMFLMEHLSRLQSHAAELGLPYPGHGPFMDDLQKLLPLDEFLRIRFTVGRDIRIAQATTYTPPANEIYQHGVKAVCTDIQVHPQFAHLKTGNYLPYLMAKKAAEEKDAFEGLLRDQDGHIVDGSRSSPLLYCDNTLTICQGGLDGITRRMVAKKAAELGFQIESRKVKATEMTGQLLLAGSGIGLVPVGAPLDGKVRQLIASFEPQKPLK